MDFIKATARYESWLEAKITVLRSDLRLKHEAMARDKSAFSLLRGSFYRWAQRWKKVCPELADAPIVLSVGDLHVENFGTWRDSEGRLIWGVNDFDETFPLPYTNDLLRLATSAHVAIAGHHLSIGPGDACAAILDGYRDSLSRGGRPFVLAEHSSWLRQTALSELRDPVLFWNKMAALKPFRQKIPRTAREILLRALPENVASVKFRRRIAGLGSLGRQRIVAVGTVGGGLVAREIKTVVPSACVWAAGAKDRLYYDAVLRAAVRCGDPTFHLQGRWIVRRLAPDCTRIELDAMPKQRDESRLLHAMGWETANIHLGTPAKAKKIERDLRKRPASWLHENSRAMFADLQNDAARWRRHVR